MRMLRLRVWGMTVKSSLLAQVITAIAIGATASITQSGAAVATTFACGTTNGTLATIARTAQGEMPMIIWNSEYFKDVEANPQQQCEEVSQKFQTYYDAGTLNYITTGKMNGKLVACVAESKGGECSGELFALKSDEKNPRATLQRLLGIRVPADEPISETGPRVYISLDKYLNGQYPPLGSIGGRTPRSQGENTPR